MAPGWNGVQSCRQNIIYHFPFFSLAALNQQTRWRKMHKKQKWKRAKTKQKHHCYIFYDMSNNIYDVIYCTTPHYCLTLLFRLFLCSAAAVAWRQRSSRLSAETLVWGWKQPLPPSAEAPLHLCPFVFIITITPTTHFTHILQFWDFLKFLLPQRHVWGV